ncbi:unnamed protein product [Adineta ricciae]|uniref:Uncharacterized protein n=1 Tax=Adineta ricciae TaxID=249248 RepID=A0A815AEB3_ADIRI|nr:unnamed protein product [Adineta ricciae]
MCYFEVKGTNGAFHEDKTSFHISQNELDKCKSIAVEREAYFLIIIEHCLNPAMIALAKVFDWSSNFDSVSLVNSSYKCRFITVSPIATNQNNIESNVDEDEGWETVRSRHRRDSRQSIDSNNDNFSQNRDNYDQGQRNFTNGRSNYRGTHETQQSDQSWRSPQQRQQGYTQNSQPRARGRESFDNTDRHDYRGQFNNQNQPNGAYGPEQNNQSWRSPQQRQQGYTQNSQPRGRGRGRGAFNNAGRNYYRH